MQLLLVLFLWVLMHKLQLKMQLLLAAVAHLATLTKQLKQPLILQLQLVNQVVLVLITLLSWGMALKQFKVKTVQMVSRLVHPQVYPIKEQLH